jgi:hypothetical protein
LLFLAELVGLIVLERHQLFEPAHEQVGEIKPDKCDLRAMLMAVARQISTAGQVTVALGASQFGCARTLNFLPTPYFEWLRLGPWAQDLKHEYPTSND